MTSSPRSTSVYYVLALLIIATAGVYSFLQWQLLTSETLAVTDNQTISSGILTKLATAQADLKAYAQTQADTQAKTSRAVAVVLPLNDDYTELTRTIDNYILASDTNGSPLFQSSLRFGKGAPVPGISGLSELSVSMNLEGTRENLLKFLDFIERSGSLESGVRLMAINSIQLNFPDGGEVLDNLKQVINFTVEMVAYYQTPKIRR